MKTQLLKIILMLLGCISFGLIRATAQHSEFFGMTPNGGEYGAGTIYKTDCNGNNLVVIFSFPGINHRNERSSLTLTNTGKIYWMSFHGGRYNEGVMYEYNTATQTYSKKFEFNGTEYGSYPDGSLLQANNGKFYGTTTGGGSHNMGVIFEWDPITEIYSKKFDFNGNEYGCYPQGNLMQSHNGEIYGMTYQGGINDYGILFKWDPLEDAFTKIFDFNWNENGGYPQGSLIEYNDKLYGMASGGINGYGVVFELDPTTNICVIKHNFNNSDGSGPCAALVQANNGKFYGFTSGGGAYNQGVLFELDPVTESFIKKLDFDSQKGAYPAGYLVKAKNGKLYGKIYRHGSVDKGMIFEWDPSTDTYAKKLDFNGSENGSHPLSLATSDNGKLYGITEEGGEYNMGILFEWDPATNTYKKNIEFRGPENGSHPMGSLVQASNGKLYGLTREGGAYNYSGTLFELDPVTGTYTTKLNFNGIENGGNPNGSMIRANNGKLYGMTERGGAGYDSLHNNFTSGVLFEFDPVTDTYIKKLDFSGVENGKSPQGSLVQANNGKLYGMTTYGGVYEDWFSLGYGVLFEWNPATGIYTKKKDFSCTDDNGFNPNGSLVLANNGKLYGTTPIGGKFKDINNFGGGVLFEWDPDNDSYIRKIVFDSAENGINPVGSMVQADNGKFYGMTTFGGIYSHEVHTNITSNGVLFEWDPITNMYNKIIDFNGLESGYNPMGSLMKAKNGKLYGTTPEGGANDEGVLFEWDPETNTFTKKIDFGSNENVHLSQNSILKQSIGILSGIIENREAINHTNLSNETGRFQFFGSLIEIIYDTYATISTESCDKYLSPSSNYVWTTSGIYIDTISNAIGHDSIITVNLTIRNADASITQNQEVLTANAAGAAYQWINCGNGNVPIEGESHQSFTPIVDGKYAVVVLQNGCTDTSECFAVSTTGFVESDFKQNVTLYPNPNTGSFTIDLGKSFPNAEITLTEPDGRIVQKSNFFNSQVIDMQVSASPGFYVVIITSGNERAVFKILKK